MRKLFSYLRNATFFLLCYAAVPLLAGEFLLDDCIPLLIMQAALLPITFLLALLPGKIGGGARKSDTMVVRTSRGGDPDPDRALRNEALPMPEKKAFPLRAVVCLLGMLGVLAAVFFLPVESVRTLNLLNRSLMSVIMAIMLPLALRVVVASDDASHITAGIILYAVAGIVAYFTRDAALERWLLICGLGFLLMTAFSLNNQSMARGASVREGVRPPASMRRRNRIMLIVVAAVGAIVLYFDKIRQVTIDAAQWLVLKIWEIIMFLSNLGAGGEVQQGAGGGGGDQDLMGALPPGESSAFWKAMEKVAIVASVIIAAVALFFFLRMIGRRLMRLIKRLIEKMKQFTQAVGEEYKDEQESLFDWGETKKELGDSLKKRIARLTFREKKWELMDARERVRYIVRSLYRKSPDADSLRALTVHEALQSVKTGQAQPEELARLYDQARYSQREPDMHEAERLRKEAKV